ncbi:MULTISPECIES: malto-oligosyltrehalose synthase [Tsukamurella]|uniref:Malto-oligosyltrehalose synthase n=2 Tax=Tsukamurella TaxID=2060 RepID=A0A5C5S2K7_9ACTN|nr:MULTISPECIES: malto-oligosyltrehalose synthase [Tsukamurella]NMD54385.1 malto-oligosyltrehalose synthase [Tsukamurella columbiensis]TWS28928.1 malto-oligosyltrehalose synthase [Tsukamurella conjunctivitidis]
MASGVPRPVGATYRLQLGPSFTFEDAARRVPYLADLGVTHLYLSPVLEAVHGSAHGYDVTDPTRVRAELGGRRGLERLADAAHVDGLGLVMDIVPNHLGVGRPEQNPWWWDVLTHGRKSAFAHYFDIDWDPRNGAGGKLALPVLASEGDVAAITVDRTGPEPVLRYHDRMFPIGRDVGGGDAERIHYAQPYRLVPWDSAVRSYRRFFTVDDLAAVRVEDSDVFAATHAEIGSWFTDGIADGLRVDHPDGLADPVSYLHRLRELTGPDAWIVIEKILEPREPLEPSLPVAGTTGYDALRELGHALLDPDGAAGLGALHERWTGDDGGDGALRAARGEIADDIARGDLGPELRRLARAALRESTPRSLAGPPPAPLVEAAAVRWARDSRFYRDDYPALAEPAARLREDIRTRSHGCDDGAPGSGAAFDLLAEARDRGAETAARFAQFTGALTAKTVEDTLFYRTARLISLQEVGGSPSDFGPSDPHSAFARRAAQWPAAMTTLSTHDTKRGEDVRARIGVLSQCPDDWATAVGRWMPLLPSPPDPVTGLFLLQTVFGVWPEDGAITDDLRARLHAYAEKAMREGRRGTSWTSPDGAFEAAGHAFLDALLADTVGAGMTELVARLAPHGRSDSLAQKLLQLAGPGVPDVYQGTERWEDSLVDPDNRRPVDWSAADDSHPKQHLVRTVLRLRRERPESFVRGSYRPLVADGTAAGHLLGFHRGPSGGAPDVAALATRHSLRLERAGGWADTRIDLGDGAWTDRLTGHIVTGRTPLQEIFLEHPVALLVRE